MASGRPLGGFPVIAAGVTLLDGAWLRGLRRRKPSPPPAFAAAALVAMGEAMRRAGRLLEPVMRVEAAAPCDDRGAIEGDLASRRGVIEARARRGEWVTVTALVPLVDLMGYGRDFAALTQRRGTLATRFAHDRPVPPPGPDGPPPAVAAALRA